MDLVNDLRKMDLLKGYTNSNMRRKRSLRVPVSSINTNDQDDIRYDHNYHDDDDVEYSDSTVCSDENDQDNNVDDVELVGETRTSDLRIEDEQDSEYDENYIDDDQNEHDDTGSDLDDEEKKNDDDDDDRKGGEDCGDEDGKNVACGEQEEEKEVRKSERTRKAPKWMDDYCGKTKGMRFT